MALLKRHPKVASCWRQNSGTFQERNRDGSIRRIRANTQRGMSDIMGVLKDGRTLGDYGIEDQSTIDLVPIIV
jgi:hypothetical protein